MRSYANDTEISKAEKNPTVKSYAADIEAWGSPEALAKGIRARMDGYPETIPNLIGTWDSYPRITEFVKDYPELF
jgi:hypothetical protein